MQRLQKRAHQRLHLILDLRLWAAGKHLVSTDTQQQAQASFLPCMPTAAQPLFVKARGDSVSVVVPLRFQSAADAAIGHTLLQVGAC